MMDLMLSTALVIIAILFVGAFGALLKLRSELIELRILMKSQIEAKIKEEFSSLRGNTALVEASYDDEAEKVFFDIQNIGDVRFNVKSFKFLDEDFKVLGEVVKDYPDQPPGKSLSFSISLDHDLDLDTLLAAITIESEQKTEDVLVRLPFK